MIEDLKSNFQELLLVANKAISIKTQLVIDSLNIDWERKEPEIEKLCRSAFVLSHYDAQYCYDVILNWSNEIENQDQYKMIVDNRIGKDGTSMKDCYMLLSLSLCARVFSSIFESIPDEVKKGKFGFAIENSLFKLLDKFASAKQKLALTQFFFKNIVKLLIVMVDIRFVAVTDRLLANMKTNSGHIEKNCKFIRQISLKFYPTEKLEESADFLKSLCELFFNTSEHPLKKTLSDTIVKLLLPAIHTLKAELKMPTWSSFIDDVLGKLLKSLSKSKYASYNFPLCVHVLCASPDEKFLAHWTQLLEIGIKYKDISTRNQAIYFSNRLVYTYISKYCNNAAALKPVLTLFSTLFPTGKRGSILTEYSEILMVRLFMPMFLKYPVISFKNIALVWLQQDLIMNNNGKIDAFCHERFFLGINVVAYYSFYASEYESLSDFKCDVAYEDSMSSKNVDPSKLTKIEDLLQVLHLVIFRYLNLSSQLFVESSLFGEKFSPSKFIEIPFISHNVQEKLALLISNLQTPVDRVILDTYKLIIEFDSILLPNFDISLRSKSLIHGIMSVSKPVSMVSYQTLKNTTSPETLKSALEYVIKKLPMLSNPLRWLMTDGIGFQERYGLVHITCDLLKAASSKLTLPLYLECLNMIEVYCCLLLSSSDTILASCSVILLDAISRVSNDLGLNDRLCHLFETRDYHSFSYIKSWKKMFKSDNKEESWKDLCFKVVSQYAATSKCHYLSNFRDEIIHASETLINEINMSVENATLIWAPRITLDQKIYEDLDCYLLFILSTSTIEDLKQIKKFASLLKYVMTISNAQCRATVVELFKRFKSSISEILMDEFKEDLEKVISDLAAKSPRKTKKYTKLEPRTTEWLVIFTFLLVNSNVLTTLTKSLICEELLPALFEYIKTDHSVVDSDYYNFKIYFNMMTRHVYDISDKSFIDTIGSKMLLEVIDEVKNWSGYYKAPVLLTRHDTAVSRMTESLRDFNEKEKVAYMFDQALVELQEESISLILKIGCRDFKQIMNNNNELVYDVTAFMPYINFIECVLEDGNVVQERNIKTKQSLRTMISLNPYLVVELSDRCFSNLMTSTKAVFYSLAILESGTLDENTILLGLINLISFPNENRQVAFKLLKQSFGGDSLQGIIANIKQLHVQLAKTIIYEIFACFKAGHSTYYPVLFKILNLFIDVEPNDLISKNLIYLTFMRYDDSYMSVIELWKSWFNNHQKQKCESLLNVLGKYNLSLRQIKFIDFSQVILKIVYTECCKDVYLSVLLNSFTWEHLIFLKGEELQGPEDEDILRSFQEESFKGTLSMALLSYLHVSTIYLLTEEVSTDQCLYLLQFGLLHYSNASLALKIKISQVIEIIVLKINVPYKIFSDPTDYFLEIMPHLTEELKIKMVDQIVQWLSYCPIVKFHIHSLKYIQIINPKIESYIFLELINLLQKTLQDTLEETIALKEQVYETIYYLLHEKQFNKSDKSYALFLTNIIKYCPEDDANFSTFTRVSKMFLQLYPKTWFLIEQETQDSDVIELISTFTKRYFKRHLSSIDYFTFIDKFVSTVYPTNKNDIYLAFVFIGLLKLREEFGNELLTTCEVASVIENAQIGKYLLAFSKKKLKDFAEFLNQTSTIILLLKNDAFHSEFSTLLFDIYEYSKDPLEIIQFIKKYVNNRKKENSKIFVPNFDLWLTDLKFEEPILTHMMQLFNNIKLYEQTESFVGNPLQKHNSVVIYNDSLKTFLMKWKPDFQMKNTLRFSYEALMHDSIEESMRSSMAHFDDHGLGTRLDFIPSESSLAIFDNGVTSGSSSSLISMDTSGNGNSINKKIEEEEEDEIEIVDLLKHEPIKEEVVTESESTIPGITVRQKSDKSIDKMLMESSNDLSKGKHRRNQSVAPSSSKSSSAANHLNSPYTSAPRDLDKDDLKMERDNPIDVRLSASEIQNKSRWTSMDHLKSAENILRPASTTDITKPIQETIKDNSGENSKINSVEVVKSNDKISKGDEPISSVTKPQIIGVSKETREEPVVPVNIKNSKDNVSSTVINSKDNISNSKGDVSEIKKSKDNISASKDSVADVKKSKDSVSVISEQFEAKSRKPSNKVDAASTNRPSTPNIEIEGSKDLSVDSRKASTDRNLPVGSKESIEKSKKASTEVHLGSKDLSVDSRKASHDGNLQVGSKESIDRNRKPSSEVQLGSKDSIDRSRLGSNNVLDKSTDSVHNKKRLSSIVDHVKSSLDHFTHKVHERKASHERKPSQEKSPSIEKQLSPISKELPFSSVTLDHKDIDDVINDQISTALPSATVEVLPPTEDDEVFPLKKKGDKRKRSQLVLEMNSVCTEGYLQKNMEQYKNSISSTLKIDISDISSFELLPNYSQDSSTKIRVELNADEDVDLKSMESEISNSIRNGSLVIPVISNQISLEIKGHGDTAEIRKSDSSKSDNFNKRKANSRPSVKNLFQ